MDPIAYGIDFGTTNSAMSVAWADGTVSVLDPEPSYAVEGVMPSLVYTDREGVELAGVGAIDRFLITGPRRTRCSGCSLVRYVNGVGDSDCRQYRPRGGCNDARLIAGIKGELADPGFTHTHSWARDFSIESLVAIVLRALKEAGDRHTGHDVRRAVVGHPAVFAAAEGDEFAERQVLGEARLLQAAHDAGFDEVELLSEPAAAVMDEVAEDGPALVVDFGGGTFDCAAFVVEDEAADILAIQGIAIGGRIFDGLVFDELAAADLGLHARTRDGRYLYPARFRELIRTLAGAKHLLSDASVLEVVTEARALGFDTNAIEEVLFGGQAHQFYRGVEEAKIGLSDAELAPFSFVRPGIDIQSTIERRRFEQLISRWLDRVFRRVDDTVAEAEFDRHDVNTVIRTGGSSQIPLFIERLQDRFPRAEVRTRSAFTAVATGMGHYAQEVWRHA